MDKILNWFDKLTGKIFWVCLIPVITGTLMAYGDGVQNWLVAGIIFCIAIIIYSIFAGLLRLQKRNYLTDNTIIDDIIAFILLGPFALAGTYYAQSHEINWAVIIAGFSPGLLSVAVLNMLHINNITKEELQSYYSRNFIFGKYLFCLLGAFITPVFIYTFTKDHVPSLFTVSLCFYAIPSIINLLTKSDKLSLEYVLSSTVKMLIVYGIIFSVGWIL